MLFLSKKYYFLTDSNAVCGCSITGTKEPKDMCHNDGKCNCQKGYSGDKCHSCASGYYKSNGQCRGKLNFLHIDQVIRKQ